LSCYHLQIVAEFYQRKAKQQGDKKEDKKQDDKADDKLIDA
jgi:hypothetical protein